MSKCIQANQVIERINRNKIRCAFEFENKCYLILENAKDDHVVIRTKWDFYRGFRHVEEGIPQNILAFARKMIDLNLANEARYPLKGEWYSIQSDPDPEKIRWSIKKSKKSKATTAIFFISLFLHMIIALLFATLIIMWTGDRAQTWLYPLMPNVNREILKGIVFAVEYVGSVLIFLLVQGYRDVFSLYFNAMIPYGIIVIVGLLKCYWWMWIVIPLGLVFSCFLSAYYIIIIEERWFKKLECIRFALIIWTASLVFITLMGGLNAYTYTSKVETQADVTVAEIEAQYRENCLKLEEKIWNALTVQEKLDLLQVICDYECEFVLGCDPVEIYSGLTRGEGVWGAYSNHTKSFIISQKLLKYGNVEDVLDTALHETRHAYQYSLVDMYFSLQPHIQDEYKNLLPFQQAQDFAQEIHNYCSGEEDYEEYYNQDLEMDSREWATKRLREYYLQFIYPDR